MKKARLTYKDLVEQGILLATVVTTLIMRELKTKTHDTIIDELERDLRELVVRANTSDAEELVADCVCHAKEAIKQIQSRQELFDRTVN